jgi:hypothetical protein
MNRSFTSMGFLITTRAFFSFGVGPVCFFQVSHLCPNFRKNCQTFTNHQLGKLEREIIVRTFTKLYILYLFLSICCVINPIIYYMIFFVSLLYFWYFSTRTTHFFPPGRSYRNRWFTVLNSMGIFYSEPLNNQRVYN